jgi:hypothetical protein
VLQVGGESDFVEEPLGAEDRRQVRLEDLDRDLPLVAEVDREIYRGHSTGAELPLDSVSPTQCCGEAGALVAHAPRLAMGEDR